MVRILLDVLECWNSIAFSWGCFGLNCAQMAPGGAENTPQLIILLIDSGAPRAAGSAAR